MQFIPVIKAEFSASLLTCHMILQKSYADSNIAAQLLIMDLSMYMYR